jgi:hypothetical protein
MGGGDEQHRLVRGLDRRAGAGEWAVVTRDLWKDRGTWQDFVVTGFTLTAVGGGEALLDAVILGPTLESLDAYRPGRAAPATVGSGASPRLGDAWSDPKNPIVRIFGGKRLDLWSLKKIATGRARGEGRAWVADADRPLHPGRARGREARARRRKPTVGR